MFPKNNRRSTRLSPAHRIKQEWIMTGLKRLAISMACSTVAFSHLDLRSHGVRPTRRNVPRWRGPGRAYSASGDALLSIGNALVALSTRYTQSEGILDASCGG